MNCALLIHIFLRQVIIKLSINTHPVIFKCSLTSGHKPVVILLFCSLSTQAALMGLNLNSKDATPNENVFDKRQFLITPIRAPNELSFSNFQYKLLVPPKKK